MSQVLLIPAAELQRHPPEQSSYPVFGGSFDPIHEGHVEDLRLLLGLFPAVVAAPASLNPWKHARRSPTPLPVRIEMMRLVLASERIPLAAAPGETGVYIYEAGYVYAEDAVTALRSELSGKLYWAVASDIADEVAHWRNWQALNVPTIVLPIKHDIHASTIREGRAAPHPAIIGYITEHDLYPT